MDIRRFLKKRTLPDSPDTTAVSEVSRVAGDDSISTPMNSQEGKDVGNDSLECNNANLTQPQESTSKVSWTTLSEDTEAIKVSGSKGAIMGKKLKFQPHWKKIYSRINYNSVTNGMLCQYCSHICKEDREVLKHTQGAAWISFPMSNWKKALDKMKAHEASAWHKMAKAKVEVEKQCQAEGSIIFGSSWGKRGAMNRRNNQTANWSRNCWGSCTFVCRK